MLSVLLAACAAASNAIASVLQRKATLSAPPPQEGARGLAVNQLHRPAFLGGIIGLTAGFLLQATALSQGALAVVQSVLASELPLTLFAASMVFHRRLGRREAAAAVMMAAGLAAALAAAAPSPGHPTRASNAEWALVGGATLAVVAALAVLGWRSIGSRRAALFGTVAGGTFGLTAALMSAATQAASSGIAAIFLTWQLYVMIALGVCAVGALQLAFQAGLLAAAQPGVTLADPVVATVLGVVLFGEKLRLGWFGVIELVAIALIVAGVLLMARSPLLSDDDQQGADDRGEDDQPSRSDKSEPTESAANPT